MATKKIEIQDSNGNVYYPHTDASVVKNGSKTVAEQLSESTQKLSDMASHFHCNLSASISAASGVNATVVFNNIVINKPELFELLANGEIKIKKDGRYNLFSQINFDASNDGAYQAFFLYKNGTPINVLTTPSNKMVGLGQDPVAFETILNLNANDVLKVIAKQGTSTNVSRNIQNTSWIKLSYGGGL